MSATRELTVKGHECRFCKDPYVTVAISYLAEHLIKKHPERIYKMITYRPNGSDIEITYYVCMFCKATVKPDWLGQHTLRRHFHRVYRDRTPNADASLMEFVESE